jgi:serralysin
MTVGTFEDFFSALRMRESSGSYQAVNQWDGSLGAYQFQEIALRDIGWYQWDGTAANDFTSGWTAKANSFGVFSRADYLNSPAAQDAAMTDWAAKLWGYITGEFALTPYIGTFVNGVELTPTALIGGAHLVGIPNLADYIRSGGTHEYADPYGTTVTDYVKLFAPYTSPYDAPATGGSTTLPSTDVPPTDVSTLPSTDVPTLPSTDVPSVDTQYAVLLADGSTIHDINGFARGKSVALSLDGHSESGATVAISNGSRIVGATVADDAGSWNIDLPSSRVEKQYVISITDPGSTDTSKMSLYVGSTHGDTITGTGANDIIVGGPGNDMLQGGGGSDVFVFNQRLGKDTVADFTSGDVLAFDKSIVSSAADVFKHASQVGADTLIVLGSDSVVLKNVQVANLHNEDFRFI